jgi:hypothetical protein
MMISPYKWLSKTRSIIANNHRRRAQVAKKAVVGNDKIDYAYGKHLHAF